MACYVIDNDDPDELTRLRAIEAICDVGSVRRLQALGVAQGWRCLELGAGGGSIARWLAAQVGDPGAVLATDLAPLRVAELRAEGIDARVHDITRDELPAESFDLIHCRCVLHHLPERDSVLQRLLAMLRPGGTLLLEEYDAFTTQVGSPAPIAAMWRALMQALRDAGAAPEWAHELPGILAALGMHDIRAAGEIAFCGPGSQEALFCQLTWQQFAERFVRDGWITPQTLAESLRLITQPGCYFMLPVLIAVSARRPGAAAGR